MMLGPVEGAFLAAGHAAADEVQVLLTQRMLAPPGVHEVRVAAVDHDVAVVQQRDELVDHRVGGRAGLDHDDDGPGPLQAGHEVRHRLARQERALVAVLLDQAAGPFRRPVVQRDRVAVAGQVPGQIAAHHGQAGDADVGLLAAFVAGFSAGFAHLSLRGQGRPLTENDLNAWRPAPFVGRLAAGHDRVGVKSSGSIVTAGTTAGWRHRCSPRSGAACRGSSTSPRRRDTCWIAGCTARRWTRG